VVHLLRVDEWLSVSQNSTLLLPAAQEVSEINVEEASCVLLDHVVSAVSVSYA